MRAHDVAKMLCGRLLGDDVLIDGIASLPDATPVDLSFILWPKDIRAAKKARAAAIVADVASAAEHADQIASPLIVVEDVGASIITLKLAVDSGALSMAPAKYVKAPYVDATAVVHRSALVHSAFVGSDARLGPNVVVHDGAVIGESSIINAGVVIHSNVVIERHVTIGANSVIGSEGFIPMGINTVDALPCFGGVHIGAHARIGGLCTIDRGLFGNTRIGAHTLIDNMVHVGHDVVIGDQVVIAAQTGLAGFVRIGDRVTLGGQVGITPHVIVHDGARISGKSLVHCDIKKYEIWSGNPSVPHAEYLRSYGKLRGWFKSQAASRNVRKMRECI